MDYEFHPLARSFNLMDDDKIDKMARSIKVVGQVLPIFIYEGKILDGQNRFMACQRLGIEPETKEVNPSDPVAFVEACNLDRRHDNAEKQIAALKNLREEGLSWRQVEAATGVSKSTAQRKLAGVPVGTPAKTKGKDGKKYPAKSKPRKKTFPKVEDPDDDQIGELSEAETTEAILDTFCSEINSWAGRLRNTKLSGQQVTRCRAAVNSLLQELI